MNLIERATILHFHRHRMAAFGERFFWCGFYEADPRKPGELVVGPYQGTLGCLRIPFSKGVCGACAISVATTTPATITANTQLTAPKEFTRAQSPLESGGGSPWESGVGSWKFIGFSI